MNNEFLKHLEISWMKHQQGLFKTLYTHSE